MSCENHPKSVAGESDMKILAEQIGDLNYEVLKEFIKELALKLSRDAGTDCAAGRINLGLKLLDASTKIIKAYHDINDAWEISKPFMKQAPPLEFGQVYKHKQIGKSVVSAFNVVHIKDNPEQWEFVCEKAHEDGDFSYLCGFQYCRCCD